MGSLHHDIFGLQQYIGTIVASIVCCGENTKDRLLRGGLKQFLRIENAEEKPQICIGKWPFHFCRKKMEMFQTVKVFKIFVISNFMKNAWFRFNLHIFEHIGLKFRSRAVDYYWTNFGLNRTWICWFEFWKNLAITLTVFVYRTQIWPTIVLLLYKVSHWIWDKSMEGLINDGISFWKMIRLSLSLAKISSSSFSWNLSTRLA